MLYFNLDGDPSKDNSDYLLTLNADYYTPVDSTFMTTGEIVPVEGTPMDFRLPAVIGTRINQDFEQLRYGNGIDHNWVLNTKGDIHQVCATLESPVTGIVLNVYIIFGPLCAWKRKNIPIQLIRQTGLRQ